MGMFDQNLGKPFSEHFKEGESFTLEAAKVGPTIPTDYGESQPVLLQIGGEWYSVFGQGLVSQVRDQDESDLPADVKLVRKATKGGQSVKLLVPASESGDDDIPF